MIAANDMHALMTQFQFIVWSFYLNMDFMLVDPVSAIY